MRTCVAEELRECPRIPEYFLHSAWAWMFPLLPRHPRAEKKKGEKKGGGEAALAHARVAVGGSGQRMRTLAGPRTLSQPFQPPALHPRPTIRSPLPPQEWGSRCSGSRAQWPPRAVSVRPARAVSRSPSVSGAEGSVKRRRRWFLFPFLPLLPESGVASSSTPPPLPLPLPLPGPATAGGGGGRRRATGALLPSLHGVGLAKFRKMDYKKVVPLGDEFSCPSNSLNGTFY
ncbi:uncharacterized protein LOC118829862 [Trichosurus vulpecula]|uniref:uncharacterized protein LOC118829862 n=1 Tax=Trichosurus vulpecula TaxID=9337 RepID=UPI00186B18A5|nr:uncharacterized protein LOC118829862 [Trichosurus vulpecula]